MNKLLIITALSALSLTATAQNCEINLSVLPMQQGDNIPDNISDNLVSRLTQVVTANGISADPVFNQFFVSGKFNHQYKDVTGGTQPQTVIKTMLTVYIGDTKNNQIFATETLDLQGVGSNYDRAYINALSRINARNEKLKAFLENGKKKILDYYDTHTADVIAKAEKASIQQHYGEALYYLTAVPECSNGFALAKPHITEIFQKKIDYDGKIYLQKAQAAWNANPTASGAAEAVVWLKEVNPQTSVYTQVIALGDEIRKTIKSDIDFEIRDKYHDAVELERQRIEAARQIGRAFGEGQQQQTTNLMWVR